MDKMDVNIDTSVGPEKTNYDLKLFASLLVPSALSGLLCVLMSMFAVGTIALVTTYRGSGFKQEVLLSQVRVENDAITEDYNYINDDLERNVLIDRAPVMVFWMFVGTLVYFMITGVAGAIASANALEHELSYVHAKRKELLRGVFIKSAIRLCVFALWLAFIMLFFRVLLPYCLAAAHVGAADILSIQGAFYTVIAFLVLIVALHIHVVMLRLVALRPRIFSQETSF